MKDLLQPPLPDEPLPETASHQPPLPNEPLPGTEPGSPNLNVTATSISSPKTEGIDAIQHTNTVEEIHDVKSTEVKEPEDGWTAIFEPNYNAYYFYNSKTGETTWDNPRANDRHATAPAETRAGERLETTEEDKEREEYAQSFPQQQDETDYAFAARFNRRTGRFVGDPNRTVDNNTVDARTERKMRRIIDPDAAENQHDGRSLRAERAKLKYTKKEMAEFKLKYKEKKNQARRGWLTKESDDWRSLQKGSRGYGKI